MKVYFDDVTVFHWDYSGQPLNNLTSRDCEFLTFSGTHAGSPEIIGCRFRWTWRLHSDSQIVLSFIAEHTVDIPEIPALTFTDFQNIIYHSYEECKKEFEKKLIEHRLTHSIPFLIPDTKIAEHLQILKADHKKKQV